MIMLQGMSQEATRELCLRENISCIGTVSDLEGGYDRIQIICYQKGVEQFCGFYHILWDKFVNPTEVADVFASGSSYQVRPKGPDRRNHEDCLTALKAAATWAQ